MDYYEFNATNPKIDRSGGKKYIVLKKAFMTAAVLALSLIFVTMSWKNENVPMSATIFYNILIILLIELPLWGCAILFSKLARRYFEYDYFILGDILKIVKISNKMTRKSVLELNLCDIDKVGIFGSDEYAASGGDAVIKSFACNMESPLFLYIASRDDGQRVVYVLEYDADFVSALRKALKRETAFDKNLLRLLKKKTANDEPGAAGSDDKNSAKHNGACAADDGKKEDEAAL